MFESEPLSLYTPSMHGGCTESRNIFPVRGFRFFEASPRSYVSFGGGGAYSEVSHKYSIFSSQVRFKVTKDVKT